jgi:hypothetical protein
MYRKVLQEDIDNLQMATLIKSGKSKLGNFSNVYHQQHIQQ